MTHCMKYSEVTGTEGGDTLLGIIFGIWICHIYSVIAVSYYSCCMHGMARKKEQCGKVKEKGGGKHCNIVGRKQDLFVTTM